MSDEVCLIAAMAEVCKNVILKWDVPGYEQPPSLQSKHLVWMCEILIMNAGAWQPTKLHRWLGFIQGAMIANRMLNLDEAKRMFDKAKNAYGPSSEDLLDHLNPDVLFEFDLGGEA